MAESKKPNLPADGQRVPVPTETESEVLCGASSHPSGTNKVKMPDLKSMLTHSDIVVIA